MKQIILHGALGGARLGCWGRYSPAPGQHWPCQPRASTGREEELVGMWPGGEERDPLAAPSSGERELQRDTTMRADQESWKRRK